MRWRSLHLVIGLLGFAVFVGTGLYMALVHHGLQGMPDGPRMFFRSAHIYLLWSSLLNLLLGCHFAEVQRGVRRWLQAVGSLVIAVGPLLLGTSFFIEQYNAGLLRPIGQLAVFVSFAGAVLHVLAKIRSRAKPAEPA